MFAQRFDSVRGTRSTPTATAPATRQVVTERLEDRRLMSAVAFADFDGDGMVDAADYVVFKQAVDVRPGNGDGTFGAAQRVSLEDVPGQIDHVAVGDFNGDGTPDLLTAGTYGRGGAPQGIIAILIGLAADPADGRVEFGEAAIVRTHAQAVQGEPVVGDWNGDGLDDVAFHNRQRGVLIGMLLPAVGASPAGTDAAAAPFVTPVNVDLLGVRAVRVAAGDLNGDGRDDLAYIGGANRSLYVRENVGDLRWGPSAPRLIQLQDLLVSSITDNGTEDLVVIRNGNAHVFEGDPQRLLGLQVNTSPIELSAQSAAHAVLADVDGDGHTDLFSPVPKNRPVLALGDGTGVFVR